VANFIPTALIEAKEETLVTARLLAKQRVVPVEELHLMARETMSANFLRLRDAGKTKAGGPEELYGFRPEDVAEMHLTKQGFGRGLWYRLKDGRVIDAAGRPSDQERYWYVSNTH